MANIKLKEALFKTADKMIEIVNRLENNKTRYNSLADNNDIANFLKDKQRANSILGVGGNFAPTVSLRPFTKIEKDKIEALGTGNVFLGQYAYPNSDESGIGSWLISQFVSGNVLGKVGDYAEIRIETANAGEFKYSLWKVTAASQAGAITTIEKIVGSDGKISVSGAGADKYSRASMEANFAHEEDLWIDDSIFSQIDTFTYGNNYFAGTMTTISETNFNNISTVVNSGAFTSENAIELISLPHASTIGDTAFQAAPLHSINIPQVTTIGDTAFQSALLQYLELPNLVSVGAHAFGSSPLIELKIIKATTIGDGAFASIVNSIDTLVLMQSKFNTDAEKNRIFGNGKWDQITFVWFNGSDVTSDVNSLTESTQANLPKLTLDQKIRLLSLGEYVFANDLKITDSTKPSFTNCALKSVKYIQENCFLGVTLGTVDFQNALYVGEAAFKGASITSGDFRNCKYFGNNALQIVQTQNATFKLNVHFKGADKLRRIFGSVDTSTFTFTYYNDDGSQVTS